MLQGATVNYLQGLAAEKVKEIADKLGSEVARAALQGLVACAGAAAQGGSCGAGASGAAASVVLNNLLDGLNGKAVGSLTAEEKEARSKLISSIVAGTAAATGGETAATTIAAKLETENNALAPPFLLPGIPGKPQVTPLPGLPGYDKTEQDLGLEPRGFAEQLAELMGKGLEGIPLTQAGWAQYLIENLGGAVRVYDPNSYSTNDSAADGVVNVEKEALGRIGHNTHGADLTNKQAGGGLAQQQQRRFDEIANLFDKSKPNDTLDIGGKKIQATPPGYPGGSNLSGTTKVFKSQNLTDQQIRDYAQQLAGNVPLKQVAPNVFNAKLSDGTIINLRSISSSQQQTGARWTIDFIGNPRVRSVTNGKSLEMKFK